MQHAIFKREIVGQLLHRRGEPRRFIQVVTGPWGVDENPSF